VRFGQPWSPLREWKEQNPRGPRPNPINSNRNGQGKTGSGTAEEGGRQENGMKRKWKNNKERMIEEQSKQINHFQLHL
jgi:hypothetical protein